MIAYAWEMGVAEQQLRWIFYADFMPWEFTYAEARHMWDESRHGDSGYHRLRDFGFDFEHFGYNSYGRSGDGKLPAMSSREVYEEFFSVTQVAETGYFETKRYCFDDFLAGGDEASAEMMQFDIIDETSHVEYGRIWMEEMARRSGVTEDYRERGRIDRAAARKNSATRVAECVAFASGKSPESLRIDLSKRPDSGHRQRAITSEGSRKHYEWMLQEIRQKCALKNAADAPTRPVLPM
jgi:hypothetical protein